MTKKSLFFTLSLLLVFSAWAFAGEGSDTIGACRLQPELRYGYSVTEWETDSVIAVPFTDWDTKAHDYYGQLTWGVHPYVDLVVLVGGRSTCSEPDFDVTGFDTGHVGMFLWGVGVKGTFYRADNGFYFGGGLLFTHAISEDYTIDAIGLPFERYTLKLRPDLHVGWNIKSIGLTPYAGVEYTWGRSVVSMDIGPFDQDIEFELQDPFSLFTGIDYYLNDGLYVNVEGRTNFAGGWGIGTGIGYKFDICGTPPPPPPPPPVIEPKLEPMSKN